MTTQTHTDLKFFTNEPGETLYHRFVKTLEYARYFDVLVGYFRTSGFHRLYTSLETVEKIRILVGLNVDRRTYELITRVREEGRLDYESHARTRETFARNLTTEMNESEDSYEVELSARKFLEFLESGKMEMRAYPSQDLHAKVYITRFVERDRDFGRVITGSSNFSESGLLAQREFNVELKDAPDVRFALQKFEELWADGVDISQDYLDTIRTKTWLSDQIKPYELYLKFLFEYFKEDINIDEDVNFSFPDGFLELAYQKQAVLSAKKILESYNGVFIADVVGLGKTFISALLLQQIPGRKLIICPPVLADYWKETLLQFYVPGCEVESLGKLDQILARGTEKYKLVLIDEAHRFRNELTQSYEMLHRICQGKKVVLVSATPLNNKLADILAQLKLFQPVKRSDIPGVRNLEAFFKSLERKLQAYDKADPAYLEAVREVSQEVRDKVLKHVMVRRTRTEIKRYFSEDLNQQGLSFPELADPHRIIYAFDAEVEEAFNDTIGLLKGFSYARYTPLLYLKAQLGEFERQAQRNVGGFMKGLLVKRLESSFYAFRKTVRRFIESYERFIAMYRGGTVYISKKVNVYDLLESDDEARLLELVEADKVESYLSGAFTKDFLPKLERDLALLKRIEAMWREIHSDPKLEQFVRELRQNPLLKGRQVIIFSESKETGEYLYSRLERAFPEQAFFYASSGGTYGGITHSVSAARELIKENYDPKHPQQRKDIKLLVTTDVLAEGINLHRSNAVVNYDLPWNPTRVLQRVGRVNRVGTEHGDIYVFNFFPTSQSDAHLGLENNIKAKIQAFHDTLGEDAKYLSDEEVVSTHALFGESYADRLYRKLSDKANLEGEEEDASELKYLKLIREIRDDEPELFERVKRLPKKSRTGREIPSPEASPLARGEVERLLTFFRKGRLKKFFMSDHTGAEELTFLDAATLFECAPETPKLSVPKSYYDLLERNKEAFKVATMEDVVDTGGGQGGTSNEKFIVMLLKSREFRQFKGFTDEDEAFLKRVLHALESGAVAKNTSKTIRARLKGNMQPLKALAVLRRHLHDGTLEDRSAREEEVSPGEVILCEYLLEGSSHE